MLAPALPKLHFDVIKQVGDRSIRWFLTVAAEQV
jgi:hypothetical protein